MNDLIGKSLGRYQILEQLGVGGMAIVYKAFDTRLEAHVAVKVIRIENILPSVLERALKRFEREAKALARLTHPNIVKVIDYGEFEGKPYLVMPYLSGGTLKDRMGSPIPWREAIQTLLPIVEALDYAHDQNMIHRDVKPSNIILTESGQLMLTDFGIAKVLDWEETQDLTGTNAAVGTPEYMAPEQATARTADHRADIYALGVVLYEMVTGQKPYTADTPLGVMFKHASEPLPRPRKLISGLPGGVEKILLKALAKNPNDRYKDMGGMKRAFEKVLDAGFSKSGIQDSASKSIHEKSARRNHPKQSSRSTFWIKVVSGLLGVSVVFAVGFVALNNNKKSPGIDPTSDSIALVNTSPPTIPSSSATSSLRSTGSPTKIIVETPFSVTPSIAAGTIQVSAVDGMILHYVPAGIFTMGDTAEHASAECQRTGPPPDGCGLDKFTDEEPVHQVYLDAFWIDETEVTNAQYLGCVKDGACTIPTTLDYYPNPQFANYPVVFVTWENARSYCEWAGRRLPTEAEWEKAARGTDGRTYPWGEDVGLKYANYNLSPGDITRVGSYELGKSPYGLYDMSGNVYEFVADRYDPNYYKTLNDNVVNPTGPPSGQNHVGKGGGFAYNAIRPADRDTRGDRASNENGFRCALSADPTTSQPENTQTPAPTGETSALATEITDDKVTTMVLVPEGEFIMGMNAEAALANCEKYSIYCNNLSDFESLSPAHSVYLDAYYIDKFEVTNQQYAACVTAGRCQPPRMNSSYSRASYFGNPQFDNYPVIHMDWTSANTYCEWRGAKLPTEAQWEKAARGTDGRIYPWGDEYNKTYVSSGAEGKDTTEVGIYPKGVSPYGAYDMLGNVAEWVADWFDENYYKISPTSNPLGPVSGTKHTARGSSWFGWGGDSTTITRWAGVPYNTFEFGFRCARNTTP